MISMLSLCAALLPAIVSSASAVAGEQSGESGWRYVVPGADEPHHAPTATPLGLEPEPPDDVRCELERPGEEPRYGQLRYGDPDSVRVAFLLDLDPAGAPRLFVDRNRNRVLEEEELVPGSDGAWIAELAVSTRREEEPVLEPRRVLFRLGRSGRTLSYATLGCVEGRCLVDGRECAARRIDADGDGFLTGPRDQLWIDLDGDGQWSSLRELFLFAPVVEVQGQRYKLRSDRLGRFLELEKIEGLGRLRLELAGGERQVTSMHVLLSSKDGVMATVRSTGQAVEVPPGEYRFGVVTLWLADPDGGADWGFIFSGTGRRWYEVLRDQEITIDPIGTPCLGSGYDAEAPLRPGVPFSFRPWLTTEDGLLLNIAHRGQAGASRRAEAAGARTRLLSPEGRVLGSVHSGYS